MLNENYELNEHQLRWLDTIEDNDSQIFCIVDPVGKGKSFFGQHLMRISNDYVIVHEMDALEMSVDVTPGKKTLIFCNIVPPNLADREDIVFIFD